MARSFVDRMIGAATLDVPTFEEVEHDTSATTQAVGVVALVAAAQAVAASNAGIGAVVGAIVSQLVGVGLWCLITYFIGTRLFGGTATAGEVFRTVAFALSPQILIVVTRVPLVGVIFWLLSPILFVWVLIAVIIGVRQALDVSTFKAVLSAFLGGVAYVALVLIIPGL